MNMYQESENMVVRESIFEALLSLLSEKPLSKITVTEIASKAGVSRMAYYRNFDSKEAIFTGYLDDLFLAYQSEVLSERNDLTHASVLFFQFFRKYGRTLKHFYHSSLMFLMAERFDDYLRHLLKQFDTLKPFEAEELERTLSFVSGGMFSLLTKWLKDDLKGSDEEMGIFLAETLATLLS